MKNRLFAIIFICTMLLIGKDAHGQVTYPITASVQFTPPSTTYLTDLTAMGSNQLIFNLFLNDFNELNYPVRLKISIEGNGISLITRPGYLPPIINLSPGLNSLPASELEDYFNPNNMLVNGISPQALQQNGSGLPEGVYTVCVQAFDYQRVDVPLSLQSCATQLFRKNYPPNLVAPACSSTLPVSGGNQDVFFSWQANSDMSIQTNYKLSLNEVLPGQNPNDAINNAGTLILDSETIMNMTSFQYGPNQQPLEEGKRYVYRIQTEDALEITTFENNGLSPVCTFYYGVDPNGYVPVNVPENNVRVSTRAQMVFQWEQPTNKPPGEQVYYRLKVVQIDEEEDDLKAALENQDPWYEFDTPNLTTDLPNSLKENGAFPPETYYAWQVKAFYLLDGDEKEIAESECRSYHTAPAIEKIKFGNPEPGWITVMSLEETEVASNGDWTISGTGKTQVRADGEELEVHFTDIIVAPFEGFDYMLVGGSIVEPVSNFLVHLDNSGVPDGDEDKIDDYGRADFDVTNVVIEKDDLKLQGRVKWKLPHPAQIGTPIVQSEELTVVYNKYEVIHVDIPVEAATFELTDPAGLKLNYFASENSESKFMVNKNILSFVLDGSMTTSNKVKSISNQTVSYQFSTVNNPYYFSATDISGDDDFRVIPNTTIQVNPKKVIFDLSEEESPSTIADVLWKGMYFEEFDLRFPANFESGGRMTIEEEITLTYLQNEDHDNICTIDKHGLNLNLFYHWEEIMPIATLNTFESNFSNFLFEIKKNQVTDDSYIANIFGIPLLSPFGYFLAYMDISNLGIQNPYLNEDSGVVGFFEVLNEDDYMRAVGITVKQAAFVGGNHLQMTVDIVWPSADLEMTDVPNFKIWGNGDAGFNTPNGAQNLPYQVNGYLPGNKTYEYTAEKLTLAVDKQVGVYGVAVTGSTGVSENVSGPDGPSKISIGSIKTMTDASKIGNGSLMDGEPSDGLLESLGNMFQASGEEVSTVGTTLRSEIKVSAGPTIGFQYLSLYQPNDEVWGDVHYTLVDVKFNIPTVTPAPYDMLMQFIAGKTQGPDPFSYWFLELGLGTLERSTPKDIWMADAKANMAKVKNAAGVAKTKVVSTLTPVGNAAAGALNTGVGLARDVGTAISEKASDLKAKIDELRATDPNAEPGKFAKLKNAAKKKASVVKVKCQELQWEAEKIYYGVEKTRSRSGVVLDRPWTGAFDVDESKSWKTKLSNAATAMKTKATAVTDGLKGKYSDFKNSNAYQTLGDVGNSAKTKCANVATSVSSKAAWAGGGIKKGASFAGTKFKKGAFALGNSAKKTAKAVKTKANALPTGIPMPPLLLTGMQGRFYHHMSHDMTDGIIKGVAQGQQIASEGGDDPSAHSRISIEEYPETTSFNYTPDRNVGFGMMLMANVEDLPGTPAPPLPPTVIPGEKFRGYGAIEFTFSNGGMPSSFGIEVEGGVINYTVPIIIDQSLARAYVNIGYHAPENKFRAHGFFKTETMVLCGAGDFDFEMTPNKTLFRIASPQRKFFFLPGCLGFYGLGYMKYEEHSELISAAMASTMMPNGASFPLPKRRTISSKFDVGIGLGWQATARQSISLLLADIEPYATVGAEIGLSASIDFLPPVSFEKFGVWMDVWAEVGVFIDWPWPVPNQTISIGATLSGNVDLYPGNPWRAKGELKGKIKVVGLKFPFKLGFDEEI